MMISKVKQKKETIFSQRCSVGKMTALKDYNLKVTGVVTSSSKDTNRQRINTGQAGLLEGGIMMLAYDPSTQEVRHVMTK